MTKLRLPVLSLTLLLPLLACGQGSGQEAVASDSTGAAIVDTAGAEVAETPARAEEQAEQEAEPEPAATETRNRQEPPAASRSPTRQVRSAPAGTQVWATLLDSLDSETAEVGDRFAAEVSSPVTDGTYVLVPAGARLLGRLTEVRPAGGDSAAVIAVAFDSLEVREETVPIAATVTDVQLENRSEMKDEGKKIGIGAAAGAVIGAVVGKDVKGAIIGAAGGAAAGTAIALGTRAQYAVLPAGSEVTLELDEALEVRMPGEE